MLKKSSSLSELLTKKSSVSNKISVNNTSNVLLESLLRSFKVRLSRRPTTVRIKTNDGLKVSHEVYKKN